MNADQVIEGIGQAVAAVAPQEYCLFWSDYWWWMCMTKSEWSGWMQAVGAVLAILGAFCLSKLQELNNVKRSKKSAILRVKAYVAAINSIAKSLNESEQFDELHINRLQAYLREVLSVGATIPAEVLNAKWLLAFESSRLIGTQLVVLCEQSLKNPENLLEIMSLLAKYRDQLVSAEEVVKGTHPGVFFKYEESNIPDEKSPEK